jgi:signal transduction histidine kinase
MVPLTVLRNGDSFETDWRLQTVQVITFVRFGVVSLLVYGSFWLAGTFVLRFMRPADATWVLLISLFYLMTIWLAVGLYTQSNVASSAIILRVIGWLMAPVMVHLHLQVPSPQPDSRLKVPVTIMYAGAFTLLAMQLAGWVPWLAYLGGILLAALVSVALLAYRLLTPRPTTEKIIARLMLAGIVLSLAPGLILSVVPLLLQIGTMDALGAAISILSLPILPLFYTYAIYKHQFGQRERSVNRLLVQYTLVMIYFILLALVFVALSNWTWTANALLSFIVLLGLSVTLALLPLRRPLQTVFERLTYGRRYSHREILADYAQRIPAAVDTQGLLHLLKYQLAPELEIRQSALVMRHEGRVELLYSQGVAHEDVPSSWSEVTSLLSDFDHRTTSVSPGGAVIVGASWVRMALPLRLMDRTTGIWLFGRREQDDIYSNEDLDLLERLAGLVAATLRSGQLLDTLSNELETRRQAEESLAEQSERYQLLHQIDRAILAAGPPAAIARAAFAGLRRLVPCIRASVFLFDTDRDVMTILAAEGSGTDIIADNDTVPLFASGAIDSLLRGQVYLNEDVSRNATEEGLARLLEPAGVRAVVSAPLVASGAVFGALSVANSQPASYRPSHIAIVEEVATSVALAVHNARLREEVDRNSEELRRLSARLIDAQETERKRLSHELHDEMGQLLAAISLNLAAIKRALPPSAGQPLEGQLADAKGSVQDLTERIRSLSLELRPSMLHDLGLSSTLRWIVANHARRNEAIVNLNADELPDRLPEIVEITVFRVVQEALTNTSRHARATRVDLTVAAKDDCIAVFFEDNGCGFDLEQLAGVRSTTSGIGLAMMRERVAALDGRLEVRSRPGQGTRIIAEIPVKDEFR